MTPIYIGAGIGFILGSTGFFLTRFWLVPISRYRKIKREILTVTAFFDETLKKNTAPEPQRLNEIHQTCRQLADRLNVCYQETLPYKYKLYLNGRNESPPEAAKSLMGLANIRNMGHAARKAATLRQQLNL